MNARNFLTIIDILRSLSLARSLLEGRNASIKRIGNLEVKILKVVSQSLCNSENIQLIPPRFRHYFQQLPVCFNIYSPMSSISTLIMRGRAKVNIKFKYSVLRGFCYCVGFMKSLIQPRINRTGRIAPGLFLLTTVVIPIAFGTSNFPK